MYNRIKNFFKKDNDDYIAEKFEKENIVIGQVNINMHIHRADSDKVLIIYPGAEGTIDGYNQKYLKIANWLSSQNVATVIRLDNEYCLDFLPYVEMMILKLSSAIEHIVNNSERIAGRKKIDLCLAGVSAGAGAIATVFSDFPEIKKALLIAPYDSVGLDNIERGLKNYRGELYLIAGEQDQINAHELAKRFYETSCYANKRIEIISNCDHQFTGEKNGKIFSNSFLWAFADQTEYPNPKKGITLYQ